MLLFFLIVVNWVWFRRETRPDCIREEMRTYNINKEKITVKEMRYHDLIYKTLERP